MKRFKRKFVENGRAENLVEKIWGLGVDGCLPRHEQRQAYINHYNHLLQSNVHLVSFLGPRVSKVIISLVQLVRARWRESIKSVCSTICVESSNWNHPPLDSKHAFEALKLVIKLWLFSEIDNGDCEASLAKQTQSRYHLAAGQYSSVPTAHIKWLSQDFSAQSLTRRGGLYLVWTSDLAKHLTFASRDQLQVFPHAQILRQYQYGLEHEMYPDGFLDETYRTIHLLFPSEDVRTARRVQRLARKRHVDIEASRHLEKAADDYARFDIRKYPFYGHRLAEIQRRYDEARPRRLQQWWYDRRRKHEWGALMVALVVFVLTVIFGVISSVTGILQVWLASQALQRS